MATINYKNIIDEIQDTLQAWNDTTSTYDLSTNLTRRVQNISKRNPAFIMSNPTQMPAICLRIDSDDKTFQEMSHIGRQSNKQSDLKFSIIGMLYHTPLTEGNTEENDPADDEIHYLAENVEEVLRRNFKLNNKVINSYPETITFYEDLDEEAYFRTFVMDFKVKSLYY